MVAFPIGFSAGCHSDHRAVISHAAMLHGGRECESRGIILSAVTDVTKVNFSFVRLQRAPDAVCIKHRIYRDYMHWCSAHLLRKGATRA
jgi:hypothetical protein